MRPHQHEYAADKGKFLRTAAHKARLVTYLDAGQDVDKTMAEPGRKSLTKI